MVREGGAVQAVPPSHFQHATRLCEQVLWPGYCASIIFQNFLLCLSFKKEHTVVVDSAKNEIHLVVSEYDLPSKSELDHLEEGQADMHLILTHLKAEKLSRELSLAIADGLRSMCRNDSIRQAASITGLIPKP